MVRFRVRQHVNPLSEKYQQPAPTPNWQEVYENFNQPLHIDIGCGWGDFLLEIASLEKNVNFLGLEIREPLVEAAIQQKQQLALNNLHFLSCNANNSLLGILKSFPTPVLQRVTIQFPDPWFKRRHSKRRVVQSELVNTIAEHLLESGIVFLQSDIKSLATEMCQLFQRHPTFKKKHQETWLSSNPFPPTERETYVLSSGKPVYRALFTI